MQLRAMAQWSIGVVLLAGAAHIGCSAISSGVSAVKDGTAVAKDVGGTAKEVGGAAKDAASAAAGGSKEGSGGAGGTKEKDKDASRLGAVGVAANTAINDELNRKDGDLIDWKTLQLSGRSDYASFQVNWDDVAADFSIDITDEDGVNVATSPKRNGQQTGKKVLVKVPQGGSVYYIKIASLAGSSVYTFRCKWGGGSSIPGGAAAAAASSAPAAPAPAAPAPVAPAPVAPAPVAPAPVPAALPTAQVQNPAIPTGQVPNPAGPAVAGPAGPAAAAPAPVLPGGNAGGAAPPPNDPMHPRGKILSSYREGNALVLYLDRGAGSNLKPGMKGHVLQGAEGDNLLDGGEFSISRIVDATKSVGMIKNLTKLPSKTNRFVIHIVPWP